MLMEVKKSLKLIGNYFKFNLSSAMEYRGSFLMQIFGMMINNASFIFFWWMLFDNVGDIGGYGFKEVMALWALVSTSFGITTVLFGNLNQLTKIIINGELDVYLLQPKDVLINVLCSRTIVSGWGDTLYGIILYIIIQGFALKEFLLFLLFSITAALIFSSVVIIFHSISFYTGSFEGVVTQAWQFLTTFSNYPESIFKGGLKIILYTLLPSGFMSYIPVKLLKSFDLKLFILLIAVTIVWLILAYSFFYKGLKRYESGNLITNKL
ncbi:ABC transporter permease [Alloiococcus sp. CFN-8]|uniref:ABC transporter permease n=1 Tax=Alloiococcus sp. CFN-8 TaxID=3416081 RepID=UPI003CF0C422